MIASLVYRPPPLRVCYVMQATKAGWRPGNFAIMIVCICLTVLPVA